MGKSGKLFKAFVAGVKAFKSPPKEKAEKDRSSGKADRGHARKSGKEKCLWSLGKSSSRNHDSFSAAAAFLDSREVKSVQVENLHFKDVVPTSVSMDPDPGNPSKVNSIQDKSVTSSGPLNHIRVFENDELAAVRIQAAIRRFLATRLVFRALQAVVKLQALVRGWRVRKQAATALRCMQALVRVQALARGRHVRSSELGQLIQKHIQQTRQQRKNPVVDGWVSSTASLQEWQAKAQSKQDAVVKRHRALVYAFSEQLNRCTPKQSSSSSSALEYQLDKSHCGWVWLERWTAAQRVGISHSVAKEQNNKSDKASSRQVVSSSADAVEDSSSQPLLENNCSTLLTGYESINILHNDTASPAAVEKKNDFFASENLQPANMQDKSLLSKMSAVENAPVSLSVVNKPRSLPPPPPPPPPPPSPPPRMGVRLVSKPEPASLLLPPEMVSPILPVSRRSVQNAAVVPPPPPPPLPPSTKTANHFFVHRSSSSDCQKEAPHTVNILSPHSTSGVSAHGLLEGEICSTGSSHKEFLPLTAPALSDLPSLPSMPSASLTSIIQPVIESFPAPSIPESYHEPPLVYPDQASPSPSSVMSKAVMNVAGMFETETVVTPLNASKFLTKTPSSLLPSLTPTFSPQEVATFSSEEVAVTTQQHRCSPLVIPNVEEEEVLDLVEGTRIATNEDILKEHGRSSAHVAFAEGRCSMEREAGNAYQSNIDMDVDEPDEAATAAKTDDAIQVNSHEANCKANSSGVSPREKPVDIPNKHAASPTSRQGQPTEPVSPSVPNYMATTKSSKAKVRTLNSPTQKLDSPKNKSESSKPRFDSSKQKGDSPKPRFDSMKQNIDSPKQRFDLSKPKVDTSVQKAEPVVKRRHSLSTLEGKGSSLGANKVAMPTRASSKGLVT